MKGAIEFNTALFLHTFVRRLSGRLLVFLQAAASAGPADASHGVASGTMSGDDKLLSRFSDTVCVGSAVSYVHELVDVHAVRAPSALALGPSP